jgi:uncharacterized protein
MLGAMARPAIVPRKPRFDFAAVPRHWFGGHRLATHVANGVNLLFPEGERFFVRSVNHFLDHPAVTADPELVAQVRGFFGQEGRHARAHEQYNEMLRRQGFRIDRLLRLHDAITYRWLEPRLPPQLRLAATAAAEHFTAIMADNAFRRQLLEHAHPVMRALLLWHAAEEIEHKAVAFDVLQRVNPSYPLRLAGLAFSTVMLGGWWLVGTLTLLAQERMTLAELRAEAGALRQAGDQDDGIARRVFWRGIRQYVRPGFHPADNDNQHLAADHLRAAGLADATTAVDPAGPDAGAAA